MHDEFNRFYTQYKDRLRVIAETLCHGQKSLVDDVLQVMSLALIQLFAEQGNYNDMFALRRAEDRGRDWLRKERQYMEMEELVEGGVVGEPVDDFIEHNGKDRFLGAWGDNI